MVLPPQTVPAAARVNSFPGSAWIIWFVFLFGFAFFLAFGRVFNAAIFFVFGLLIIPLSPILIGTFVIPPLLAVVFASVRVYRRQYKAAAAYIALICLAAGFSYAAESGLEWLMTQLLLRNYEHQIEAAKATKQDLLTQNARIRLGPPVSAEFRQPQMMWSDNVTIYSEDAASPLLKVDPSCEQKIRPLGRHFYARQGIC
jgi:hypothetical protein